MTARMLSLELADAGYTVHAPDFGELSDAEERGSVSVYVDGDGGASVSFVGVPRTERLFRYPFSTAGFVAYIGAVSAAAQAKPDDAAETVAVTAAALTELEVEPEAVEQPDIALSDDGRTASIGGLTAVFTEREYALLRCLYDRRGQAVSHGELETAVWGGEGGTNVVEVYVSYVRRKLGEICDARLILTKRGGGYMLRESFNVKGV